MDQQGRKIRRNIFFSSTIFSLSIYSFIEIKVYILYLIERLNIYNINYQFLPVMKNYWKKLILKKMNVPSMKKEKVDQGKIDRILIILKFDEFTWCRYINIYRPVRFFSKLTFASGPYVINAPITIIRTIWMKNSWYTCCFPLEKNIPCSERKKKEMNKTRIKMFIRISFFIIIYLIFR